MAALPCQTKNSEDLEHGCCIACRAKIALSIPEREAQQPDETPGAFDRWYAQHDKTEMTSRYRECLAGWMGAYQQYKEREAQQPVGLSTDLLAKIAELQALDDKRSQQKGHSWVHKFFRRGQQYGDSTCWGEKGEIFRINEHRNPNAENDYQFYAAAPEMMEVIRRLVNSVRSGEYSHPFTDRELKEIRATVGAMRLQMERNRLWQPWWIKFVEWAITEVDYRRRG